MYSTPGSMPPMSTSLSEEGAAMVAYKLVQQNTFQENGITSWLADAGCRNIQDVVSDLKAQVAANRKGVSLMQELIVECTLDVILGYMTFIQDSAEMSVRRMLKKFSCRLGNVSATDYMDDGTSIVLNITIDRTSGSATFDFTGTGSEVIGNTNAPPSVTYSAILYCLRCLCVGQDHMPLNAGCLVPITVILPPNSILNPSTTAAVVGGNVLTSQRVTDVILKAFGAAAASQGCMNNVTFGNANMGGYYETIAGGAGAGPTWHGRTGIQCHMTNTRMTDPEILERRYPVKLKQFAVRSGSGGKGTFCGGDGLVRELEFLTSPLTVSILSERRVLPPFGLAGGKYGACGINSLYRKELDTIENLGGKNSVQVKTGDCLIIETPGGGGYGSEASCICSEK